MLAEPERRTLPPAYGGEGLTKCSVLTAQHGYCMVFVLRERPTFLVSLARFLIDPQELALLGVFIFRPHV